MGKIRASPEQELCDLYWERARALAPKLGISKIEIIAVETSRGTSVESRLNDEAAKLGAKIRAGAHRIALDEAGRGMTSGDFAKHLAKLRDSSVRDVVFLIGGPDGLAPPLRTGANERLAFGAQTWPHLLARAMLVEQIYRACAILAGHPYHRGR